MRNILTFVVFMIVANIACAANSPVDAKHAEPMDVRYSEPMDGNDEARFGYIFELIHRSLEVTRPEFGDYVTHSYHTELSTQRHAVLLNEGNYLNIAWASPGTVVANSGAVPIKIDILRGLLGYRICLFNNTTELDLSEIKSLDSLRQLKVGQGINWADNLIYLHNKMPLVETPTFESLFRMLAFNRFDCIALGANEVKHIYLEKKNTYPFLEIDTHLLIYYEFPIYFYVSSHAPKLVERLELGLKRIQASGEFDRLFVQHHAKNLASLNLKSRRVICMESPYVADKNQCSKPITIPSL